MATMNLRGPLLLGGLLAGGCGDPLVDEAYRGPVLFTLRGNVIGASDSVALDATVRISVFWSPRGPDTKGTSGLVEQPSAFREAVLPFSFTLNLFDAPPKELFYTPADPNRGSYAIAQILGYPDLNHNQKYDLDEPIIAASASRALLYAATPLTATQSPTGQAFPAGYHLAYSSIPCGPPPQVMPPPPPGGPVCTVPLGQACSSDAQCAPGICLKEFLSPWPQGGCAMAAPPAPGCGPPAAILVKGRGPMMTSSPDYWLKSCTTDADCGRDFPYQCDLALRACAPTRILALQAGDPPMIAPWCMQRDRL